MGISRHDHVGHMEYTPRSYRCRKCGQRWYVLYRPDDRGVDRPVRIVAIAS